MTLRRNVITLLVWISILAIFTIHLILTRHSDPTKQRVLVEREIFDPQNKLSKVVNRTQKSRASYIRYNSEGKSVFGSIKSFFDVGYQQMSERLHRRKSTSNYTKEEKENHTELKKDDYGEEDNDDDDDDGSSPPAYENFVSSCEQKDKNITKLMEIIKYIKIEVEKLKTENIKLNNREKQFKTKTKTLETKLEKSEKDMYPKFDYSKPWVYAVTPTYTRYTQKADLIRLSQTLILVTNLHWIVVEDSESRTKLVDNLLIESGLSFTHLSARTPQKLQRKKWEKRNKHHRGVLQRNLGIKWIHENVDVKKAPGVVYFMDDDNTYHRDIFDEMRYTTRVSMWPVALTGGLKWAGPIVVNGTVVRFRTNWALDRTFPIDMAGFAVSVSYLINEKSHVKFNMSAKRGYLEPNFLEQLTTVKDIEPLADDCTKVLVWHTRTEVPKENIKGEKAHSKKENKTHVPDIEI